MLILTTFILAIISFVLGQFGSSAPTWKLEVCIGGQHDAHAPPTQIVSLASSRVYGINLANYLLDHKNMQCRKENSISLTPVVEFTTRDPELSSYIAFFISVFLPALAFVVAVVGEIRIRIIALERGCHLQKRARMHLEHKLAQSEEKTAQLSLILWDIDQALRNMEEQHKASMEDAKELHKKLSMSDHNEYLLRKDLAVSKENIRGLQATVAKKGKEALEYRAQAYRPTCEILPVRMSRMRFGWSQNPAYQVWSYQQTQPTAQTQSRHARFSENEVDAGGRNFLTGGTRETLGGNGHVDRDLPRPAW